MRVKEPKIRTELPYVLATETRWKEFISKESDERYNEDYMFPPFTLPDGSPPVFINVHERHQGYGGPEEGGWWYDIFESKASVVVRSYEEAQWVFLRLCREWPVQTDLPYYSVIYEGGCYVVSVSLAPATHQPKERPRYE